MKKLTIPYCACLQALSIEQVNAMLDDVGLQLSVDKLNWREQYPYRPLTRVSLALTEQYLYIKWHVNGVMLKAIHTEDLSRVSEDSCVEFFCELADGRHYMNLEFNCIGTCSASRRLSRTEDVVRLNKEELKSIVRYSSLGKRPFCEIDGHFTWDLCVGVPLELLQINKDTKSIRCNFYKCADDTSAKHYLSWNPINTDTPDFHRPQDFAEIMLGKE